MRGRAVLDVAREVVRSVIDVVLPESCPLCGADSIRSAGAANAVAVCDCIAQVPVVEQYCRRCSSPVGPFVDTVNGCVHCRRDRFAFECVFAAADYRGVLQSAVLCAKETGDVSAAGWLADRIWERRGDELTALNADLVVPVPQHWVRRVTARHNVPELIGRRLASRLNVRFHSQLLSKSRGTPSQASLVPSARRTNLRRAFWSVALKKRRRILLVDDVLTTGTTADRATRALKDAGAEVVWVVVAARGIGR
jgi:predicted amidophosphoribosyltransferase